MSKNDGGPAFPVHPNLILRGNGNDCKDTYDKLPLNPEAGMSLRDYFAAKAMQALIPLVNDMPTTKGAISAAAFTAGRAYMTADAMLSEREKEPAQ